MQSRRVTSGRCAGRPWIFLSWVSLALILAMMVVLAFLLCMNSFRAWWPARLELARLVDGSALLGFPVNRDISPEGDVRIQYRVGNREIYSGADFRWVREKDITGKEYPREAVLVERAENGNFMGFLRSAPNAGTVGGAFAEFSEWLRQVRAKWDMSVEPLRRRLAALGNEWQANNLAVLKAGYENDRAEKTLNKGDWASRLKKGRKRAVEIERESEEVIGRLVGEKAILLAETAAFVTADGREILLPVPSIIEATRPNAMGLAERALHFAKNGWNLLARNPREANTEGGLFPALFGTVVLVFIMAITAFPLGVAAGIYLREYARDGILARAARVAINNLAGVPSIVYGIFGLGFFVYGVGGGIDRLLYPERVAAGVSTFGGGGVLWSSLTLGLLTLPVVVVATEEALANIPSEIRQGSLALGATRFQTLWRVVLPMAGPGILTGFILAMARAAGEVAPLMLTGAVKSAPDLPLDGGWPFVHLERKFMHLGFHIYDMGFQSPNVEASKPLVYQTALVLLVLVFVLNLSAMMLRRRMRDKYAMRGF